MSARRYWLAALDWTGGAGLANWAALIGAFKCIELSNVTDRPSTQVFVTRNGILIPETSR